MTNYPISIPGSSGVDMQQGDTLTITFLTPAKFCISSGSANDFSPPLPVGIAEPHGYVYNGTAIVPNATIRYSHVGHGGTCGSAKLTETTPGTIKIGTGTK
jgi:hypothetical protein